MIQQTEFTYGEISFLHFIPIIEAMQPKQSEVFWDLGCGAGKALVTAAIVFPYLGKVRGVELLTGIAQIAE